MSSIELLSPEVVNQIAAGEVVERPAHLVKELIENSIDAGATKISIHINDGGRRLLLEDNGRGIAHDDLALALERFATSKIKTSDDLWKLKSYGFRGEALASISAVSLFKIKSLHSSAQKAYEISSHFGQKTAVVDSDHSQTGTVIQINDLFQNIPARLKFLKSDGAEILQIKSFLKGLALVHPEIEFQIRESEKLYAVWKKEIATDEFGLEEFRARALAVLELKNLHAGFFQHEKFQIRVLFSDPSTVQKTSKNIWIFLNQRLIQDRAIQTAVMESYKSLLMHGEYPTVVLDLRVPEDFVDVNVHPAKSQVKFQDASQVFRLVHSVLRSELEKAPWRLNQKNPQVLSPASTQRADSVETTASFTAHVQSPKSMQFYAPELQTTNYQKKDYSIEQLSTFRDQRRELAAAPMQATGFWGNLDVIGQYALTYIVAQSGHQLYLIDQHAAHERVRYEALLSSWKNKQIDIQDYLFPDAVELSPVQMEALLNIQDQFSQLGIALEPMGPTTLGVVSAPSILKDFRFSILFEKIAQDVLDHGGSYSLEEKISDLCATMACHSVVRAGQAMSIAEMKSLLKQMDDFALSEYCPHGRPVFVEFNVTQIEKMFGRSGA
jgi:DNA mismatch repair protein MutL